MRLRISAVGSGRAMVGHDSLLSRWERQLGEAQFLTFLRYWYWHSLRERPRAFADKILRQIGVFYSRNCPAFKTWRRYSLSSSEAYGRSLDVISGPQALQLLSGTSTGAAYLKRTETLSSTELVGRQNRFADKGHLWCAQSYLVVLVLSVSVAGWYCVPGTALRR